MPAAYCLSGDSGIRTHDLLNAIQALSQLSYTPIWSKTLYLSGFPAFFYFKSTSSLRGRLPDISRSQLSYTPIWSKTLYLCGFPAFYFFKSTSSLRGRTPDISRSQLSYTPMTAIIAKSKKNCN